MSGGQYFRMRNYGDNSAPWYAFHSDFSYLPRDFVIPTDEYIYRRNDRRTEQFAE